MHRFVRSVRCAGIISVAVLTLLTGSVLVWRFVQPETLPMLSTWELAAILSAFVLPGLCMITWQADRRAAAAAPRRNPRPNPRPVSAPPLPPVRASRDETLKPEPTQRAPLGHPFAGTAGAPRHARAVHRHRRSARV